MLTAWGRPACCLLLRLSCGWLFLLSGWGKLQHLPQAVEFFASLHVPLPGLMAPATAGTECLGGILLLLGGLTRSASLALLGVMAGAIVSAHGSDLEGLSDLVNLQEYLIAECLLALTVLGPGPVSLTALWWRHRNARPAGET